MQKLTLRVVVFRAPDLDGLFPCGFPPLPPLPPPEPCPLEPVPIWPGPPCCPGACAFASLCFLWSLLSESLLTSFHGVFAFSHMIPASSNECSYQALNITLVSG